MEENKSYKTLSEILTVAKPHKIRLSGYSMYPNLIHGDIIKLDYETSKIKDHDIILFLTTENIPKIHRYFSNHNRTKGDSSIYFDDPFMKIIARIEKKSKPFLHFYRKMRFNFFSFIPKEIELVALVISGEYDLLKNDVYIKDLNFKYLFKWLYKNNLTSVFSSQITDWKLFPETFIKHVQKDFLERQSAFSIQNKAFEFVIHFFELIDVPIVPLKGMDFTTRYYKDPYQRQMYDIDIMIEEKNLDIVLSNIKNNPAFYLKSLDKYLKHHHHFQVILKNYNFLTLEIHFKLPDFWCKYKSDFKQNLLDGIITDSVSSLQYSNEMNLCLVSLSSFSHIENIFKHIVDAYYILKTEEIDFEKLWNIAQKQQVTKRLRRLFILTDFFFPEALPENIKKNLKTSKTQKVIVALIKNFCINRKNENILNKLFYRFFLFENFGTYFKRNIKNFLFKIKVLLEI